eukprot:2437314-Rhodomonas_salina.3
MRLELTQASLFPVIQSTHQCIIDNPLHTTLLPDLWVCVIPQRQLVREPVEPLSPCPMREAGKL